MREVGPQLAMNGAAEQTPYRHAKALPFDVPQGDIDGGDSGVCDRSSAPPREVIVGAVPMIFHPARIPPDEAFFQPSQPLLHHIGASFERSFAEAGEPLIGMDFEKYQIAPP